MSCNSNDLTNICIKTTFYYTVHHLQPHAHKKIYIPNPGTCPGSLGGKIAPAASYPNLSFGCNELGLAVVVVQHPS
jgi:hypothetical protein